ncbi:hypothetical protein [Methanobrevibacter sp. DSM 116169]|uniref:hypothetical protein n=1 Tax=Methanobrevibacter sp. DSM 116169 TaxID=3242727 RepID=UPI0038FC5BF8
MATELMEVWSFNIASVIGLINIGLLIALSYVYYDNYKKIKSEFNLGLLIFSSFLLLQSIFLTLSSVFHGGFGSGTGVLLIINNIILAISLSILLKISW